MAYKNGYTFVCVPPMLKLHTYSTVSLYFLGVSLYVHSHTHASLLYSMKSVTRLFLLHTLAIKAPQIYRMKCDTCPVVLFCAVGRADCVELADSDKDRPDGGWEED